MAPLLVSGAIILAPGLATGAPVGATEPPAVAPPRGGAPAPRPSSPVSESDPMSRNVAARARMLECGHQWSSMKRLGTATGTWKEFSRRCLAQR